jgi:hypothetical protein
MQRFERPNDWVNSFKEVNKFMRKNIIILMVVIFIALIATRIFSAQKVAKVHSTKKTTYYIDYNNGNDNNSGIDTLSAWKRHPYMQGWSGGTNYNHVAGDCFIFKGGVTWPKAVFPLKPTKGGASENNDIYTIDSSWHTEVSWTQPIFDLGRSDSVAVDFSHQNYLTFNNLKVINPSPVMTYNGLMEGSSSTYITISNCILDGSNGAGDVCNIYLRDIDHITITGNYIRGKQVDGNPDCILMRPYSRMSNIIVAGNEITNPYGLGGDGMHFEPENGVEGAEDQLLHYGPITIESNNFHDFGRKMAISALGGAKNLTIRYNQFHGCVSSGCVLEFDQENLIRFDGSFYQYENVLVAYNLFYNIFDTINEWSTVGSIIRIQSDQSVLSVNNRIYNNSIVEDGLQKYGNQKALSFYVCRRKGAGWSIKNNIFYGSAWAIQDTISVGAPKDWASDSVVIDNNWFFANGHSKYGTHAHITNPIFVNITTYDLHLKNTSPCIDSAIFWGQTRDYTGDTMQCNAWDIGAFECTDCSKNPLPPSLQPNGMNVK